MKTGKDALDECHVVTHYAETASVVKAIKKGLERDGLGDLVVEVVQDDPVTPGAGTHKVSRRPVFASTKIFLPKVMIVEDEAVRELDYETDVLSGIDWRDFNPEDIAASIPDNAQTAENQLQRIKFAKDGKKNFVGEPGSDSDEVFTINPSYVVRMILDIVPNPFVGREIVGKLFATLRSRGFDDSKLGKLTGLITEELRKGLNVVQNKQAEALFRCEVQAGRIQFRLRLDGSDWQMPFEINTTEPINAPQLASGTGAALEKSLFSPVYFNELNSDERDVAVYLDGEKALTWWHRNVPRSQYGIQGWKKAKIYPDFIFAVQLDGAANRIIVLETKGDQLDNLDTAYKRDVMTFLSDNFSWEDGTPAGELELVKKNGDVVQCALILMSEWETKLPVYLQSGRVS